MKKCPCFHLLCTPLLLWSSVRSFCPNRKLFTSYRSCSARGAILVPLLYREGAKQRPFSFTEELYSQRQWILSFLKSGWSQKTTAPAGDKAVSVCTWVSKIPVSAVWHLVLTSADQQKLCTKSKQKSYGATVMKRLGGVPLLQSAAEAQAPFQESGKHFSGEAGRCESKSTFGCRNNPVTVLRVQQHRQAITHRSERHAARAQLRQNIKIFSTKSPSKFKGTG